MRSFVRLDIRGGLGQKVVFEGAFRDRIEKASLRQFIIVGEQRLNGDLELGALEKKRYLGKRIVVFDGKQLVLVVLSSSLSAVSNQSVVAQQDPDVIPYLVEFTGRRLLDQVRGNSRLLRLRGNLLVSHCCCEEECGG